MDKLFGTDGIRGKVGEDITASLAYKTGSAIAYVTGKAAGRRPTVITASDTRASSDSLICSLCAGLCSAGANVLSLGILPTPAVSYLTGYLSADAGIMISASHNPFYFNGIKIFGNSAQKLSDELEEEVEKYIFLHDTIPLSYDGRISYADMSEAYVSHLESTNTDYIKRMKVGIDCANGAAYKTARSLFSRLGIDTFYIGNSPNGKNINSNCGSTSLSSLSSLVKDNHLDLGLALDGDADRLLAVDEQGREIGGDTIIAICASHMQRMGRLRGGIVGTPMSNLGLKKFCADRSIGYFESDVGDRHVLEVMSERGCNLGGEHSGHIIFSDFSSAGDGTLSAIKLLEAISAHDRPLSSLADMITLFPQVSININADRKKKELFSSSERIKDIYQKEITALGGEGKIILRASGTEPVIRITVECEDKALAEKTAYYLKARVEEEIR